MINDFYILGAPGWFCWLSVWRRLQVMISWFVSHLLKENISMDLYNSTVHSPFSETKEDVYKGFYNAIMVHLQLHCPVTHSQPCFWWVYRGHCSTVPVSAPPVLHPAVLSSCHCCHTEGRAARTSWTHLQVSHVELKYLTLRSGYRRHFHFRKITPCKKGSGLILEKKKTKNKNKKNFPKICFT